MSTLPAKTLVSSTVSPAEMYDKLIYNPSLPPHETFEVMHGGMDATNVVAGTEFPAWTMQYGNFAQGHQYIFDQTEWVYARQLGGGGGSGSVISERAVLAQLTSNVFIPWDASVVMFGVQCFFQQEATVWDNTLTAQKEYWDYRIEFGGTVYQGLYGRLPHARTTTVTPTSSTDPGYAAEPRWRFVSKFGMAKNVSKGHNRVRVSLWAGVFADDYAKAKVSMPTGGVWMLALR